MVLAYYQTNLQNAVKDAGKFQEAKILIKSASQFNLAKPRKFKPRCRPHCKLNRLAEALPKTLTGSI